MNVEPQTPWQLARLAGVTDPDSESSPGAEWLRRVESNVRERLDEETTGYGAWDDDTAHEIADGAVPVYTYERWKVYTDLCAWEVWEEARELAPDPVTDPTDHVAAVSLYVIARRLAEEYPRG